MTARCSTSRPRHSYYVVMVDLGKTGLEAIVHPEETRRQIVERLRRGDYLGSIVFIHHVDDLVTDDVTLELFEEAEALEAA